MIRKDVENENVTVSKFDNKVIEKNILDNDNILNVYQKKFVIYLLINLKNKQNLSGMPWKEIAEVMNLTGDYTADHKKKLMNGLAFAMFDYYEDDDNFRRLPLFSDIGLKYNKLNYVFNEHLMKDLLNIPDFNYFLVNYKYIQKFIHRYSLPLYMLIRKELGANDKESKLMIFDIGKLRDALGVGNFKYPRYDSFMRSVLLPSLEEINEFSDINILGQTSTYSGKNKLCWKVPYKDKIGIGGISNKVTVQEYMDKKRNLHLHNIKNSRTKVDNSNHVLEPYAESSRNYDVPEEIDIDKLISETYDSTN